MDYTDKEEYEGIKIQAGMHGIDLGKYEEQVGYPQSDQASFERGADKLPMQFKDPGEYKGMTQEEKEELTQKMMRTHKQFLEGKGVLSTKKPKVP